MLVTAVKAEARLSHALTVLRELSLSHVLRGDSRLRDTPVVIARNAP